MAVEAYNAARALGAEVARRRDELRLTHVALAKRSGLSPNYLGAVERGQRDASLSTICKLAAGLGCKPAELLVNVQAVGAPATPCEHLVVQRTFTGPYICHYCKAEVPRDSGGFGGRSAPHPQRVIRLAQHNEWEADGRPERS